MSSKREKQLALLANYDATVQKANDWRTKTQAEIDDCHGKLVAAAWKTFQLELAKTNQKE